MQFSNLGTLEAHGFARNRLWTFDDDPPPFPTDATNKVFTDLILRPTKEDLKIWPHRYILYNFSTFFNVRKVSFWIISFFFFFFLFLLSFEYQLRITLGPGTNLMLTLRIRNTNTNGKQFTFTFAYHTYFSVSDIRYTFFLIF